MFVLAEGLNIWHYQVGKAVLMQTINLVYSLTLPIHTST